MCFSRAWILILRRIPVFYYHDILCLQSIVIQHASMDFSIKNQDEVEHFYNTLIYQDLERNYQNTNNWIRYKHDTEVVKSNLQWLPKKCSHQVLVPVAPRALMRGKLVHTNEVLVNLGDNWLVKRTANQAIEICDRRIKVSSENIERLEKERNLIEQRQNFRYDQDTFGSEERPEIIEEITEEEDQIWRNEHRENVKRYKHKLREMKDEVRNSIDTKEDLWKRLDELEQMEELEDELDRMEEEDDSDTSEDSLVPILENSIKKNGIIQPTNEEDEEKIVNLEKSVSSKQVSFVEDDATDDEPLRLEFTHSSTQPVASESSHIINSPADIYLLYKEKLKIKSILKSNVNPNQAYENAKVESLERIENVEVGEGVVIPDIIEKSTTETIENVQKNQNRKISKFKMSRMNKK